jgi:hypothetical protein
VGKLREREDWCIQGFSVETEGKRGVVYTGF